MPKGARVLIRWCLQDVRAMKVVALDEDQATSLFHAFCAIAELMIRNMHKDEKSRTVFFQNGSTLQFLRDTQE
jgi:hypothetical protein